MKAKEIMREIFKDLRNLSCLCRMAFGSSMDEACKVLGAMRDRRRLRGAVYWHRKDEVRYKRTGVLEIRYFVADVQAAQSLGCLIANELEEREAIYHWEGTPDKTITVYDTEEIKYDDLRASRTDSV